MFQMNYKIKKKKNAKKYKEAAQFALFLDYARLICNDYIRLVLLEYKIALLSCY